MLDILSESQMCYRKTAAPVSAKYIQRMSPAAYSWKATVNSGFIKSHRGKITIWKQGDFFAPCSIHFLFAFCFFLDFCLFWKYGICCWLLASPWRTSAINLDRQDIFQSWAKIQLQSLGGGNAFVSSVRSSNSHPDLLVTHHPTHFFRSHRSSTLDFHFLSHYSYIKAIKLYKGNQWTHLLAICIPYGYNRTSLQDSARLCKIVQDSAR